MVRFIDQHSVNLKSRNTISLFMTSYTRMQSEVGSFNNKINVKLKKLLYIHVAFLCLYHVHIQTRLFSVSILKWWNSIQNSKVVHERIVKQARYFKGATKTDYLHALCHCLGSSTMFALASLRFLVIKKYCRVPTNTCSSIKP